ncbi:nucleoside hydrolase [Nitratireductor aquimarinus]|uniref:nucleoside hydrolase n=1 Tax=Nitratireductor aquimarinus TaxID=889300 RepID=UPI001A8D12CC|nr:nucleoside hydrolase [Nitratireductor aquimarinus]MBN8245720.1 nucleoside hydrolase [Nitratireductor aquimarinus]MBY6134101.1 nucleoside hydrolase [Nitratireductor aquimarinus]MCA1305208.1 nucleoside hydrolase [Nitratireductor aquimarinus]
MREKIIIDTDPGQDDAIAIFLALAAEDRLETLGVCAVAGNVPVVQTTANALRIMDVAGRRAPVYQGAEGPLVYELETAEFVCGPDGMDGAGLPGPVSVAEDGHAVDFIIRTLRAADDASITLCALGPLTNIALAFRLAADVKAKVKRIVVMGGAMNLGNITPAAEFNFYVDPHAASVVFNAGIPIVMMGLNITHKAICTHEQVARFAASETATGRSINGMLTRPRPASLGSVGHPVHDMCVIAYLLWPELFSGRDCDVQIDASDGPLRGRSTIDWNNRLKKPGNALVIDTIEPQTLFDRAIEKISILS